MDIVQEIMWMKCGIIWRKVILTVDLITNHLNIKTKCKCFQNEYNIDLKSCIVFGKVHKYGLHQSKYFGICYNSNNNPKYYVFKAKDIETANTWIKLLKPKSFTQRYK